MYCRERDIEAIFFLLGLPLALFMKLILFHVQCARLFVPLLGAYDPLCSWSAHGVLMECNPKRLQGPFAGVFV